MAKQTNSQPSRGTVTRPSGGNGQGATKSQPNSGGAVRP
jgi:hypothetical protein